VDEKQTSFCKGLPGKSKIAYGMKLLDKGFVSCFTVPQDRIPIRCDKLFCRGFAPQHMLGRLQKMMGLLRKYIQDVGHALQTGWQGDALNVEARQTDWHAGALVLRLATEQLPEGCFRLPSRPRTLMGSNSG